MNETDLKKQIKKDLPKGTWHFSPVSMGMGKTGIPDIICCIPTVIREADVGKTFGLFVGIEAKMKGNKPTPNQTDRLNEIAAAGGVAIVTTQTVGKRYDSVRILHAD